MLVKVFTSGAKHEEEDDDIGSGDGTCHTRSLKHLLCLLITCRTCYSGGKSFFEDGTGIFHWRR